MSDLEKEILKNEEKLKKIKDKNSEEAKRLKKVIKQMKRFNKPDDSVKKVSKSANEKKVSKSAKTTTKEALQDLPLDIGEKIKESQKKLSYEVIKKPLLSDIGTKPGQFIINPDYGNIGRPSSSGRYFKTTKDFIKAEKLELKEFLKNNKGAVLIHDKRRDIYRISTLKEFLKPGFDPDKELKVDRYTKISKSAN